MASDLISTLLLDKASQSGKVILVKEINSCDSSFVTSCVLAHAIKTKSAVLLIALHNPISHYQNVGLRLNYNLKKSIDLNLIQVYNFQEESVNAILENSALNLDDFCSSIVNKIFSMQEKHGSVNVILDGLSHLFDLKFDVREVNKFCREITKSVRRYNNTFVLFHCNITGENDSTHIISNLLAHSAFTVATIENLPSGWSTDVSGHLTVLHPGKKFENENLFSLDLKPSQYLFKLFDRGVKLFAPGTV